MKKNCKKACEYCGARNTILGRFTRVLNSFELQFRNFNVNSLGKPINNDSQLLQLAETQTKEFGVPLILTDVRKNTFEIIAGGHVDYVKRGNILTK